MVHPHSCAAHDVMVDKNNAFILACKGREAEYTPVWFMRQAGRYLPGYMELRKHHSIMEMYKNPTISSAITTMPVESIGVDAAIVFADLMTPLEAMGIEFDIASGGPIIKYPIKDPRGIEALKQINPLFDTGYVMDTIRRSVASLQNRVPIIGFSGAPFTLASYIIEGVLSKDLHVIKEFMHSNAEPWHALMIKLAEMVSTYSIAQVSSGASAIQLFDSWAGNLCPADYEDFVMPYMKMIFRKISEVGVPSIYFSTCTSGMFDLLSELGADVISVDWRMNIDDAWSGIGCKAIQGNLDPSLMLCNFSILERSANAIMEQTAGRPGHIFNLGHGMLPATPVQNAERLVKLVHERTAL